MPALTHGFVIGIGLRDASLEARDGIPSPGNGIGIGIRDAIWWSGARCQTHPATRVAPWIRQDNYLMG